MTTSQKQLLWVAAFLAALQFVVKPVLNWQEQLKTETTLSLERLERSEQLLERADELSVSAAAAAAARDELLANFPVSVESSMLQIQLQGEIESVLRTERVRIEQFNWMTGVEPLNSSLQGIRAKVIVSGGLQQVIQAHTGLMKKMPTVNHESIEVRQVNRRGGDYRLSLTLFVPVQKGSQT